MTNIISNSVVWIYSETNTNGGFTAAMVKTGPIYTGFIAIAVILACAIIAFVWLKKAK